MIIFRYLLKEVFVALAALTSILLLIFLSNQFAQYLSRAAGGSLPGFVIVQLMMLEIPNLLGLLLPLGFYAALLVAYGRLYADSEMTVLHACGYSRYQLLKHSLIIAFMLAVVVAGMMLWLGPEIATVRTSLIRQSGLATLVKTLRAGRFRSINGGKQVFYVGELTHNNQQASDIFLAKQRQNGQGFDVLWAKRGEVKSIGEKPKEVIELHDGTYYQGVPAQRDFTVSHFSRYQTWPPQVTVNVTDDIRTRQSSQLLPLLQVDKEKMAELQWRLSLPIMVFILTLLAVPLSHVNPRQGKYAKLLPAIIIYMVYANLLFVARDWLTSGVTPAWLGLWWVHGCFILVAAIAWLWTGRQQR